MRYAECYRMHLNNMERIFSAFKNILLLDMMQCDHGSTLKMKAICSFQTICQTICCHIRKGNNPQLPHFRSCPFARRRSCVLLKLLWFHFRIEVFINQSDVFLNHTSLRCWSCSGRVRISELYELASGYPTALICSSSFLVLVTDCTLIEVRMMYRLRPQTARKMWLAIGKYEWRSRWPTIAQRPSLG
jgi:hypothetical protein